MDLAEKIRDVPDFPVKGILFKDITTLIKDPAAFAEVIDRMTERYDDQEIDLVVAIEARGFIFGSAVAYKLGAGFVPVRKEGKLPAETIRAEYSLEYGTNVLEVHKDAISAGQRVLIVDDVLATGGTTRATVRLVEELGAKVVAVAFLVDLTFPDGMERLKDYSVFSLIHF